MGNQCNLCFKAILDDYWVVKNELGFLKHYHYDCYRKLRD